jgi:hypothetical protein
MIGDDSEVILQLWQTECTVSTSRLSSTDHPLLSFTGSGVALPDSLTTRRHPLPSLHVARPY